MEKYGGFVPGASGFRRADRRGSRGLHLSDRHPRMPLLSPGLRHRAELPHHLCRHVSACSCIIRVVKPGAGLFCDNGSANAEVHCAECEAATYGCSSTKLDAL